MKKGLILVLLTLAGCQTLERHPVATWVVVGIAAGSIAASTSHRSPNHDVHTGDPYCYGNPRMCE